MLQRLRQDQIPEVLRRLLKPVLLFVLLLQYVPAGASDDPPDRRHGRARGHADHVWRAVQERSDARDPGEGDTDRVPLQDQQEEGHRQVHVLQPQGRQVLQAGRTHHQARAQGNLFANLGQY